MNSSRNTLNTTSSPLVLIVDDSPLLRMAYSQVLRSWGCVVDVAQDGLMGFESIKAVDYQLVITDLEMPECNGIEFLRRVRLELPLRAQVPFVLITGSSLSEYGSNIEGFSSVLSKPVGLSVLRKELDRCLRSY